jgi:hypothetical protein
LLWVEEKKERLFGSNIFGGRRENKNTAEGPWRAMLSVPALPAGAEAKAGRPAAAKAEGREREREPK